MRGAVAFLVDSSRQGLPMASTSWHWRTAHPALPPPSRRTQVAARKRRQCRRDCSRQRPVRRRQGLRSSV